MSVEANEAAQETTEAAGNESTLGGLTTTETVVDPNAEAALNADTGTKQDAEGAEGDAAKEAEAAEGAEEAVEYSDFQMQDGFELDEAVLGEAVPVFKELGFSQEQAQGIVDLYSKLQGETLNTAVTQQQAQVETWTKQIKDDWGGEEGFNSKLKEAAKGVDYGDKYLRELLPEDQRTVKVEVNGKEQSVPATPFRDALNETGAGNHPAIIKFVHSVSQMLSEDGVPASARGTAQPKDTASRWYGNS